MLHIQMTALRQFGVLVLLLASCVAPAMACMVPDVQMSAEERICCRMMKDQCGQMEMPASHGCCQKTPQNPLDKALATKAVTYHPVAIAAIWLTAAEWFHPTLATTGWFAQIDYSPPQFPPSSVSVLRI